MKFATTFGLDPRADGMATNRERVANRDAVIEAVNTAFAQLTSADVLDRLATAGIPAGKVRTIDEVYTWDQVASQHLLLEVDHPVLGTITIPGSPLRLDDNIWSGGRSTHLPPPGLGEHSDAIRTWLDEAP